VERRRSLRLPFTLAFLLLLLVLFLARDIWLSALGSALVYDEGPAKADVALVLAGDYWGNRMLRAVDLVKQGYVPRILVSGPPGFYGTNESDAAIRWAVQQGYPAGWFVGVPHQATSTLAEAAVLLTYMRLHNIPSFLLVTSNYHTARAHRIYRKAERDMGGGPAMRVVAARDKYFAPDSWWQSREGRKTAFMEWTKTVSNALGI
jgi:uncharacterized SAM-binding protein YcdF (DUF218 family)